MVALVESTELQVVKEVVLAVWEEWLVDMVALGYRCNGWWRSSFLSWWRLC